MTQSRESNTVPWTLGLLVVATICAVLSVVLKLGPLLGGLAGAGVGLLYGTVWRLRV